MKKELLAPAGSFDTLKQAIHNGCDAVYLAGKNYGARKFANNFDNAEMLDAIKYCHLYGVKIYVTVNTLVYDDEVESFIDYIKFLHENGVDAVIMQDMGMITLVRKMFPNLDIHVSTQAHTHNMEQIKLLEKLGVTRIVIARETSLDDINKIATHLEIEAFIHGALCVCYSGQCLFSSMLLNRSGNRGECAGICRLPFTLLEDGKEVKTDGNYLLSPKELNTTSHIKELLDSNITSFKIEGRMKNPTTIGFITRMYRYLIDHYEKGEEVKLTEEENKKLMLLFNREYTDGYLFNSKEIMNIKSPNHIGVKIGNVIEVNPKKIKIKLTDDLNQEDGIRFMSSGKGMITNFIYDKKDNLINKASCGDIVYLDNKIGLDTLDTVNKTVDAKLLKELEDYSEKKISVSIKASVLDNDFILEMTDGNNNVKVNADIVEPAKNNGTSSDRIKEQLLKLGNTPFSCDSIDVNIPDGIFIPISLLNELRRGCVDRLINIRSNKKKPVIINDKYFPEKKNSSSRIQLSCIVRNKEQLEACLKENVDYIYTDNIKLYEEYHNRYNVYLRLDRVMNRFKDLDNEKLLVGEVGSINKYLTNNKIDTDYFLNVVNSYYIDYLRKLGINKITLSPEVSIEKLENTVSICGNNNLEVVVYGKIEAMIMKYCPLKELVNKDKICSICSSNKKYCLKDRNNALYPLTFDNVNHLTHIFYYKNLELGQEIPRLLKMGIKNYRFDFLDEDSKEITNIIKKYKSLLF